MTLAEKAEFYEQEIERYIKRTPYGYVAEAPLRKPGDKTSADPQDSDNDGLWTAMYGAGECFAYGATKDPKAKERAKKAFEALRFLQKVTQGCAHAPPKGYIARTIRPVDWPDPNVGRLEGDREEQKRDRLWKVYEPRWPKSADGKWYWKSDTSSDELDGHYFFYPLYYDLCADTEAERERVREVVRDVTDHLLTHRFVLIDHDGKPTRWAIYGPQYLNHDPLLVAGARAEVAQHPQLPGGRRTRHRRSEVRRGGARTHRPRRLRAQCHAPQGPARPRLGQPVRRRDGLHVLLRPAALFAG